MGRRDIDEIVCWTIIVGIYAGCIIGYILGSNL